MNCNNPWPMGPERVPTPCWDACKPCTCVPPEEQLLDDALAAYHEAYHGEFPQGGDAGDHDNAHREGILAVMALISTLGEVEP